MPETALAKPPKKNKGPLKDIDPGLVERLARIHCTMEEIASICLCSVDTLERRFAEVIKNARADGKSSLRRKQFQLAEEGNPTMLIWLGKIVLGQVEKKPTGDDPGPMAGTVIVVTADADEKRYVAALKEARALITNGTGPPKD